ncbi:MAG: signal recognition particle-docking protein FtsY [Phycisphaerales bacterium]
MPLFKSIFNKVKSGLAKTRDVLNTDVRVLLAGRKLDEALILELEQRLIQADLGVQTVLTLIAEIRRDFRQGTITTGDAVIEFLRKRLKAMWPPEDRALITAPNKPTVVLVVGVNGVGKTTSVAKIAHSYRQQGKSVLLGACDTFRAGAVRQLEIWSERLGVELVKGQQGGDPAAVAYDACEAAKKRGVDVLLLDTAGRMHNEASLMRQLEKIRAIIARQIPGAPHETLLVLDATTGQNAVRQAEEFHRATQLTGIFLAKLDGTAKGGVVIAIRQATGVPVKLVGLGETPEDVQPFDPEQFVDAMFAAE